MDQDSPVVEVVQGLTLTRSKRKVNPLHHHPPALSDEPLPVPLYAPTEYNPPPADKFTAEERANGCHHVNQKTKVERIIEHPLDSVVEYPETGANQGESVAHIFPISPDQFRNPKDDIQYSLGGRHGTVENVRCRFISHIQTNEAALCYKVSVECMGIKRCSFGPNNPSTHFYTTPKEQKRDPSTIKLEISARREVAEKTLGFYSALRTLGCGATRSLPKSLPGSTTSSDPGSESDNSESDTYEASIVHPLNELQVRDGSSDKAHKGASEVFCSSRSCSQIPQKTCDGKIFVKRDTKSGQRMIWPLLMPALSSCEHSQGKAQNASHHLYMKSNSELDLDYLTALLEGDNTFVSSHEQDMLRNGYGPLVPCQFTADAREQKEYCDYWHRDKDGQLRRGRLINQTENKCTAKFSHFIPYDLEHHPFTVLIATNPHSHPPPKRSKVPRIYADIFWSMLSNEKWKIADATPRRLHQSASFVQSLRATLLWEDLRNPTLSELHPSLGNDHRVAYLIGCMKKIQFPHGTDWKGMSTWSDTNDLELTYHVALLRRDQVCKTCFVIKNRKQRPINTYGGLKSIR
ncbi:hypothetical protein FRC02_012077 [Tulasnella sp. 418]|nr:hypothetical protein FRC02_012077 [Tulasnella sp. 418]